MTPPRIPVARPEMGEPEWQAIRQVIESGWVTQGPKVEAFEAALADPCGAEPRRRGLARARPRCTSSLVVAGVGPGDEVVVPSMSFIATANSVVHAGATPVFAEVEPDTFNLDLADVERRITPRHQGDRARAPARAPGRHRGVSRRWRGATDCRSSRMPRAPSAVATTARRSVAHGKLVAFSFHPRKLVTTGDGGMILTSDAAYAERLRLLRQHGMSINDQRPERRRRRGPRAVRRGRLELPAHRHPGRDGHRADSARLPGMVATRQRLAARYDGRSPTRPWCACRRDRRTSTGTSSPTPSDSRVGTWPRRGTP